ncbi:hypothetical protein ACWEOE_40780 [Amycolatopsis sp. NPDC004368]
MKPENGPFRPVRMPSKAALWCAISYSWLGVGLAMVGLLSQNGWRSWAQISLAGVCLPVAGYCWVRFFRARRSRDG